MVTSEELGQTILVVIFAANTALQGGLVVHEGGGHVDVKWNYSEMTDYADRD